MDPKIDELAAALKDMIVGRAKNYLNAQIAARKEFLEERAKRLAELTVYMAKASTDADRDGARLQMETVSDTIENELVAAAVDASVEARAAISDAVSVVVDYGIKILPWIMKAAAVL